jgi:hypothetical protein
MECIVLINSSSITALISQKSQGYWHISHIHKANMFVTVCDSDLFNIVMEVFSLDTAYSLDENYIYMTFWSLLVSQIPYKNEGYIVYGMLDKN